MTEPTFQVFLSGCATVLALVATAFFFRFWRDTGDRLFLAFGTALGLLALQWALLAIVQQPETRPLFYTIRLIAFVVILLGVWDKNRARDGDA